MTFPSSFSAVFAVLFGLASWPTSEATIPYDRVSSELSRQIMMEDTVHRDMKKKKQYEILLACVEKVRSGGDANGADQNGVTPLMRAVRMGARDTAAWLMERGAVLSPQNKKGKTALDYVPGGNVEAWRSFLEEYAPIISADEALAWVEKKNAQYLLRLKDGESGNKYEPLMNLLKEMQGGKSVSAARAGRMNVLSAALNVGADQVVSYLMGLEPGKKVVDEALPYMTTPEMAKLLLKSGGGGLLAAKAPVTSMEDALVWVGKKNVEYLSRLKAGEKGNKYELLIDLLKKIQDGAPISVSKEWKNVLGEALTLGADSVARYLVSRHPEKRVVDAAFPYVSTPEMAKLLLKAGADINYNADVVNYDFGVYRSGTALCNAVRRGDRTMVDWLAARGAKLRGDGQALAWLLYFNYSDLNKREQTLDMLRFLLKRGASADIWLYTTGSRAKKGEYADVFHVLTSCKASLSMLHLGACFSALEKGGDCRELDQWLKQGVDIDQPRIPWAPDSETLVSRAVEKFAGASPEKETAKPWKMLVFLIERGGDVCVPQAVPYLNEKILTLALEHSPWNDARKDALRLMLAVLGDERTKVSQLVSDSAFLKQKGGAPFLESALRLAVKRTRLKSLAGLLDVSPSLPKKLNGDEAFLLSCLHNETPEPTLDMLVSAGLDVTPCFPEILRGGEKARDLALLLKKGANPKKKDKEGKDARFYLLWKPEALSLVLDRVGIEEPNAGGWSLLQELLSFEIPSPEPRVLRLILEAGADVNRRLPINGYQCDGQTPLMQAVSNVGNWKQGKQKLLGVYALLDLLIGYGADSEVPLLHESGSKTAIDFCGEKAVKEYLKARVAEDAAWRDKEGNSLLHAAALGGGVRSVKALVAKGCDALLRNKTGKTPVDLAAETGNSDVLQYLAGQGCKEASEALKKRSNQARSSN